MSVPSIYIVRVGETIRDVVLNATGSLVNWDAICEANTFDWVPSLIPGMQVNVPATVAVDANSYAALLSYPSNNSTISNFMDVLQTVWDTLTDRWILRNGVWDDTGIWLDNDNWKDS